MLTRTHANITTPVTFGSKRQKKNPDNEVAKDNTNVQLSFFLSLSLRTLPSVQENSKNDIPAAEALPQVDV